MCVQVPCVYIPHTASSVTARNSYRALFFAETVQVNITTTLQDTWNTCIYITLVLQSISSFYTSSILLGRLLSSTLSVRYKSYTNTLHLCENYVLCCIVSPLPSHYLYVSKVKRDWQISGRFL